MTKWDPMTLPEIEESAVDGAATGIYRVAGRAQRGECYDPSTDTFLKDVDQVLVVRVDEGTLLPVAVERAEIRPNGTRLIVAWVPR